MGRVNQVSLKRSAVLGEGESLWALCGELTVGVRLGDGRPALAVASDQGRDGANLGQNSSRR